MRHLLSIAAALVLLPALAHAQDAAQVQKLFEAGKYKEVADAAAPADAPRPVIFLAAQGLEKLRDRNAARAIYKRLVDLPETDPWHFIGASASQLMDGDISNERDWRAAHARVKEWAEQAAKMAPDLLWAQYQLGLAYLSIDSHDDAVAAFDRIVKMDPAFAYAYYYGGLGTYLSQHPDRLGDRFERFLKLAPDAPERPEVLRMMKPR